MKILCLHGSTVWTRARACGSIVDPVPDGHLCLENHIHSEMSITQFAALLVGQCREWNLQKGPKDMSKLEHKELGTAVGLLLRLRESAFNTGKAAILDSGFCALKGIIELRKRGVYSTAVAKKRRN